MAKLSGSLLAGLSQPNLGGMLSQSISGGMQQISNAYKEKRQKEAYNSMFTILNNFDPEDKQVQQSVMDVANQTGVSPVVAQEMINASESKKLKKVMEERQAEKMQMQREEAKRAQESHAVSQANAKYQQGLQKKQKEEEAYTRAAVASYDKNPEAFEAFIKTVPAEYQENAFDTIEKRRTFQAQSREYQEEVRANRGFTEESLKRISEGGDEGKAAVKAYRESASVSSAVASKNLLNFLSKQAEATLWNKSKEKEYSPKQYELELEKENIKELNINGWKFGNGVPDWMLGQMAHRAARDRHENPDTFIVNKDWVERTMADITAGRPASGTGKDSSEDKVIDFGDLQ